MSLINSDFFASARGTNIKKCVLFLNNLIIIILLYYSLHGQFFKC